MSVCIDDDALLDVAEGRRAMNAAMEAHLARCAECRLTFAAAARGGGETQRDVSLFDDVEPTWDEIGQGVVIGGRYVLEAFLGAGAMGVVWRACSREGSVVALKIARDMDPALGRRFEREAMVLAELRHRHIVQVFETLPATEARGPVIVQELLDGESLESRLERVRTLSLSEASRVVVAVATALREAHARGIVHRDLKPANVFLTRDGRVVVLDFGIAKLLPEFGAHTKITRTGSLMGTPRYMAPEQLFGEPVDARADVWSLGALLFRALAGRAPVEASSLGEIMKAHRRGVVLELERRIPGLPLDVQHLLGASLLVDRQRRLPDVTRFELVLGRQATSRGSSK